MEMRTPVDQQMFLHATNGTKVQALMVHCAYVVQLIDGLDYECVFSQTNRLGTKG